MKRTIAQDLDLLGAKALPQHKQRLAPIIKIWLANKIKKDPIPRFVAMSLSYTQ